MNPLDHRLGRLKIIPNLKTMSTTLWKEKTLSFSPGPVPWDSIWTERLDCGSLPTFLLTETWSPEYSETTVVWIGLSKDRPPNSLSLSAWDGTIGHAVSLIAELFHYRKIYDPLRLLDVKVDPRPCYTSPCYIPPCYTAPRPLILIAEEVHVKNLSNPLISECIPLKGTREILSFCAALPPSYVVFTQSGIFLDDFRLLWDLPMEKTLLALSSRQVPASGNLEDDTPSLDVHDSWVFRSEDLGLELRDFAEGNTGSFGHMLMHTLKNNFRIVNPSLSLITWNSQGPTAPETPSVRPTRVCELKPYWSDKSLRVNNCFQASTSAYDFSMSYFSELYELPGGPVECHELGTIVCVPDLYPPTAGKGPFYRIAKLLLEAQGLYTCLPEEVPLYARFGLTNTLTGEKRLFFSSALVHPPTEFTKEMIGALQRAVSWSPQFISYDGRPVLVLAERETASASLQDALRPAWDLRVLSPEDSFDRILAILSGAWGLIGGVEYAWMLPVGGRLFAPPSAEAAALATNAQLRYIPTSNDTLLDDIADTE